MSINEIKPAFNEWATYVVAKVGRVQYSHLPCLTSRCRHCGKGLGAVNDLRIGTCAEATAEQHAYFASGEPCQTNQKENQ